MATAISPAVDHPHRRLTVTISDTAGERQSITATGDAPTTVRPVHRRIPADFLGR